MRLNGNNVELYESCYVLCYRANGLCGVAAMVGREEFYTYEEDIVDRLNEAGCVGLDGSPGDPLYREAAVEIRELRAEVEGLRATLDERINPPYAKESDERW